MTNSNSILAAVLFFAASVDLGHCQEVTLWDDINYGGDSTKFTLNEGQCRNVMNFNDRTSSLKTNGCIQIWEDYDCSGKFVKISPPGKDFVGDFNDKLTSVSDCSCRFSGQLSETVEIEMDTSQAPDLQSYGQEIKQIMIEWFPFLQNLMATSAYKPVRKIRVFFSPKDEGVAWAGGSEIGANAAWLRRTELKDKGWVIHEMTHILHQARECPGWLVEGMAEWTRRWHYEPWTHTTKPKWEDVGPDSEPQGNGWLVVYLGSITGKPLIYEMNKACQTGTWHANWLRDRTGKSDKEWWDIMLKDNNYPWQRRA